MQIGDVQWSLRLSLIINYSNSKRCKFVVTKRGFLFRFLRSIQSLYIKQNVDVISCINIEVAVHFWVGYGLYFIKGTNFMYFCHAELEFKVQGRRQQKRISGIPTSWRGWTLIYWTDGVWKSLLEDWLLIRLRKKMIVVDVKSWKKIENEFVCIEAESCFRFTVEDWCLRKSWFMSLREWGIEAEKQENDFEMNANL